MTTRKTLATMLSALTGLDVGHIRRCGSAKSARIHGATSWVAFAEGGSVCIYGAFGWTMADAVKSGVAMHPTRDGDYILEVVPARAPLRSVHA